MGLFVCVILKLIKFIICPVRINFDFEQYTNLIFICQDFFLIKASIIPKLIIKKCEFSSEFIVASLEKM